MEIHLKFIGVLLCALSLVHAFFPSYFNWKEDLKSLQLINRQMMQVHTFFIALMVFMVGILCIFYSKDLVHTPLGKFICLGLGIFWMIRLFFQFFGYSSKLWKGKTFETIMHIVFTFFWLYMTLVYFYIYITPTL